MKEESNKDGFIPPHGGYRNLFSYQKAEIIYDGTVYFTSRFFHKYDRTVGQMVQAAQWDFRNSGDVPQGPNCPTKRSLPQPFPINFQTQR